jgi:hypothetical protein
MTVESDLNRQEIVDFVLEEPKRFEMAMRLCECYEEIKEKTINNFEAKLKFEICKNFEVNIHGSFQDSWHSFAIHKKPWEQIRENVPTLPNSDKRYIRIVFEAGATGAKNFYIGVAGENVEIKKLVFEALKKDYDVKGGQNQKWPYYVNLKQYKSWDYLTLAELNRPEAVEYFMNEINKINKIIEPIIDAEISRLGNRL